jgi:diguanylate cyclase (GGDEF)-like protein
MNAKKTDRDELTGLLHRDLIPDLYKTIMADAKVDNGPVTIGVVDIDNFLTVNEDYNHAVGDVVLIEIAKVCQELAGDKTLVFRYGGDEFVLLFPQVTREQAFLTLERIRAEVEQSNIEIKDKPHEPVRVTLSGGIAAHPIDGTTEYELMRKALQALYRAKNAGSNQIYLAYDEKMIPKTIHFTETQLERLSDLAGELGVTEASLLREALDDLLAKYKLAIIKTE